MKKLFMILMAVVLMAFSAVGCTTEEKPKEEPPFEENSPETPVDDMGNPGEIENPDNESPSGNDEDLDKPTENEGTGTPQS